MNIRTGGLAHNAPEIAVVASGRHEVTRKRGQYSQNKSGHYSNLFVGRRPASVKGLFCSPGRWNAISKTKELAKRLNYGLQSLLKRKLFFNYKKNNMANLKIQTTLEISVPAGVKVIRNDEWITLAKKDKKFVQIFTCLNSEISSKDLNDESNWLFLSFDELKKISSL